MTVMVDLGGNENEGVQGMLEDRGRNRLFFALAGFAGFILSSAVAAGAGTELLDDLLAGPMADADEIVFACRQAGRDGHWYANFGYYAEGVHRKAYGARGRLCALNLRTGRVRVLLDDPAGAVRDPQVHYNGRKILFSYRKGGTDTYHLYEINTRRQYPAAFEQ